MKINNINICGSSYVNSFIAKLQLELMSEVRVVGTNIDVFCGNLRALELPFLLLRDVRVFYWYNGPYLEVHEYPHCHQRLKISENRFTIDKKRNDYDALISFLLPLISQSCTKMSTKHFDPLIICASSSYLNPVSCHNAMPRQKIIREEKTEGKVENTANLFTYAIYNQTLKSINE